MSEFNTIQRYREAVKFVKDTEETFHRVIMENILDKAIALYNFKNEGLLYKEDNSYNFKTTIDLGLNQIVISAEYKYADFAGEDDKEIYKTRFPITEEYNLNFIENVLRDIEDEWQLEIKVRQQADWDKKRKKEEAEYRQFLKLQEKFGVK